MEKNTILAIVLSTVVLIVAFIVQGFNITKQQQARANQQQTQGSSVITAVDTEVRDESSSEQNAQPSFTEPAVPSHSSLISDDEIISSPALRVLFLISHEPSAYNTVVLS